MHSSDVASKMKQFEERLKKFSDDHVVGLCYSLENKDGSSIRMGSGFFVLLEERVTYITAGHVVQAIEDAVKINAMCFTKIIDDQNYRQIELRKNDFTPIYPKKEADWFDVGALILSDDKARELCDLGTKFIPLTDISDGRDDKLTYHTLVGFPWDGDVISDENPTMENSYGGSLILPSEEGYVETEIIASTLYKVSRRLVLLHKPSVSEENETLLLFQAAKESERTVCGLSGGPIFAFVPGVPGLKVVAIQSSQTTRSYRGDKYVVNLVAIEALSAVSAILEKIQKTDTDMPLG